MVLYTEQPLNDIWLDISQYSYASTIEKYWRVHEITAVNHRDQVAFISGCMRQARAYFTSASSATLDIAPVLVYYGLTNLMAGCYVLTTGKPFAGRSHGLLVKDSTLCATSLGDAIVSVLPTEHGSFLKFGELCGTESLKHSGEWSLIEVLCSIPDLLQYCRASFPDFLPYSLPLEVLREDGITLERFAVVDALPLTDITTVLNNVPNIKSAYKPAQILGKYVVLYPNRNTSIGEYSIAGQKFLPLGHNKGSKTYCPPQLLLMVMSAYILCFVSRYKPEVWNPFVAQNESGERLVIERFLAITMRLAPNLVLNIVRGEQLHYLMTSSPISSPPAQVSESEIRGIIRNEIQSEFRQRNRRQ